MKTSTTTPPPSFENSVRNLMKLVTKELLTQSAVPVYLACYFNQKEPIPVSLLQTSCKLSATIIRHHLEDFETMGLMEIARRIGKPLHITVNHITDNLLADILDNNDILDSIKTHRDQKIDRYTPGRRMNNIYIKENVACIQVVTLTRLLPSKYQEFAVTPTSQRKLERLSAELDLSAHSLEEYAKWFIKYKLDITVHNFNLGIFMCNGIVTEFKNKAEFRAKKEAYKKVSSRKASFEASAAKLEEELHAKL